MESRRLALFSDHALGVGGGEYYTYSLLQALLVRYDVDLVRQPDRPVPDPARLETAFGFRLAHPRLTLRTIDSPSTLRDYDPLINLSHFRVWPPLARRNLLVVFYPQVLNHHVHDYDASSPFPTTRPRPSVAGGALTGPWSRRRQCLPSALHAGLPNRSWSALDGSSTCPMATSRTTC